MANLDYNLPMVALSVAIALTAATAALWLTVCQNGVWQKLSAACVIGLAVAGMHYTGMAAATFTAGDGGAQDGHFLAMLASSLEQQRIQAELRLSEERFRAAVRAVRGILWTNEAKGRMHGEQPGWTALTGQTRKQCQGLGWADAVHPEDATASIDAWNATVRAKRVFIHEPGSAPATARGVTSPSGPSRSWARGGPSASGSACTPTSPSSARPRPNSGRRTRRSSATPIHDAAARHTRLAVVSGLSDPVPIERRAAVAVGDLYDPPWWPVAGGHIHEECPRACYGVVARIMDYDLFHVFEKNGFPKGFQGRALKIAGLRPAPAKGRRPFETMLMQILS